jgi:curved DNA-binding protein CbpA
MNPYEILDVPNNFTLEQLREKYKKTALKVHPDKMGGNEALFKMVTVAYKALVKEFNRKQADKQFDQLKNESTSYRSELSNNNRESVNVGTGQSFNVKRFNKVFEEHKLEDTADVGYGDWMASKSAEREEINIQNKLKKFNQDRFNKEFEKQPIHMEKKMIVYKEPEALCTTKKIGFSELGITDVGDFSGENMTRKTLNYTDYKVAHTTNRLVDHTVKARKDYRNIDEVEQERSAVSYQMSNEDYQELARRQAKEKNMEKQRLEAIRKRDEQIAKQYKLLNRLLLGQ